MPSIHPSVTELLARLRTRIRAHVVLETCTLVVLLAVALFWLGLLGDWYWEVSRSVRLAGWSLLTLGVAFLLINWGWRRLSVPLQNTNLAQLLEHHCPELGDQLSTAIDLSDDPRGMNEQLVADSHREAASVAEGFREQQVMNMGRLWRLSGIAVAAVASVITLAVFAPQTWAVYTQRLALNDTPWPRSVELSIEGFTRNEDGVLIRKVARNDDIALRVSARLTDGLRDPRHVTIRYRWQGGGRGRDDFMRIGNAAASGATSQEYSYTFERIADSVDFEIRGGDGRLRPLRLEVVDRPKVVRLDIEVRYPSYLERGDRLLEDIGPRLELPAGTSGTIVGSTNKPLRDALVESLPGETGADVNVDDGQFRITLPPMADDTTLKIGLVDEDGIGSREPFNVTISSRRDELPQVAAVRDGIGTAVTEIAQIPIAIDATDDNRLRNVWMTLNSGDRPPLRIDVAGGDDLAASYATRPIIDLRSLRSADAKSSFELAVGDVLTLEVAASDAYDLDDQGHVGTARRLQFEIVSEEELLARLARSELNLRQTFEALADKLITLYDDIENLEPVPAPGDELSAAEQPTDLQVVDTGNTPTLAVSEEVVDLRVARLTEDARQLGVETLGVAVGFREVYRQLVNNRVDNEELLDRVGNRIAAPLEALGEERLTTVAELVAAITDEPSTRSAARQATRQAVRDAEAILREMQGLENYNEVIAMLRDLIGQQEELSEKTKTEQKNQLRDLLLD